MIGRLGISTWSLPWAVGVAGYPQPTVQLDATGIVNRAAELEVAVVQFADNLPLTRLSEPELEHLAQSTADAGLAVEVGTRGLEPTELREYIHLAARLGARTLRTVLSGNHLERRDLEHATAALRELLPDLEQHQVAIALENNEAFSAAEFAEIVLASDSPLVGICLDTANSLGRPERLETVVAELAQHTIMLHAKDYEISRVDTRMGFTIEGRASGEGRVDFGMVLGALRDAGRGVVSVIVEHWPPFDGDIESCTAREAEWLTRSLAHLRALLIEAPTSRAYHVGSVRLED